jgi:hypothetical protein
MEYSDGLSTLLNPGANISKTIFLEAYYGKNPLLLEIEKQLEIIRSHIEKDNYYDPTPSKENEIICRLISELFNFESCYIQWNTEQVTDEMGSTRPLNHLFFTKYSFFDVQKGKYGIQFKDKSGKILTLKFSTAFFTTFKLSSGEIVSTILHEIGHSFYNSPWSYIISKLDIIVPFISGLSEIIKTFNMPDSSLIAYRLIGDFLKDLVEQYMISTSTGRKLNIYISQLLYGTPILKDVLSTIKRAYSVIGDIVRKIIKPFKEFKNLIQTVLILPAVYYKALPDFGKSLFENIVFKNYDEEKFADNFATSYGYGNEYIRGEIGSSTNQYKSFLLKTPNAYGELYNLAYTMLYAIVILSGNHPHELTRCIDQINLLEFELKKVNVSEKHKKEMRESLVEMREFMQKIKSEEHLRENNLIWSAAFRSFFASLLGYEGDPREFFFKTVDYDYPELNTEEFGRDEIVMFNRKILNMKKYRF